MAEPPPPLPPKELPIKRFKFIWRVLMISNLALGAYMFVGARKRDMGILNRKRAETGGKKQKAVVEVPSAPMEPSAPTEPSASMDPSAPTDLSAPTTTTTVSKTWDM